MELLQELRLAARRLFRDRALVVAGVAALGLGIGSNGAMFTVMHAILLRGLPYDDPDRIVAVSSRNMSTGERGGVSLPDFEDYRRDAASFSGLAAFRVGESMALSAFEEAPRLVTGSDVTPNIFRLLGQKIWIGRDFRVADSVRGADSTVILGNRLWRDQFAANPGVLGEVVRVNGEPVTVIGVMPDGVRFPYTSDIWRPLRRTELLDRRDTRSLQLVGRLAEGVTLDGAEAEVESIAGRLRAEYPDTNDRVDGMVQTFNDWATGSDVVLLYVTAMGAVGFVLIIACGNVTTLLLARSARRMPEVALRVALGATRGVIVIQLLLESLLLAAGGGLVGFGVAVVGVSLLEAALRNVGIPWWMTFTIDGPVIGFQILVCAGASVLFGLAPAVHLSRAPVSALLRDGGRFGGGLRVRRIMGAMVVVEVALAVVLLTGTGLMIRSFQALYDFDLGFDADQVLTGRMTLSAKDYPTPADRLRLIEEVQRRLSETPGIRAATTSTLFGGPRHGLEVDGRPTSSESAVPDALVVSVGSDYFASLGLSMLRGRELTLEDGRSGSEVIVNARLATLLFGGDHAIGRRIRLRSADGVRPSWLTIVGVGPNVRFGSLRERNALPVVYVPWRLGATSVTTERSMSDRWTLGLQVLSAGTPSAFVPQMREAVRVVDPNLPLSGVQTMGDLLQEIRWPHLVTGTTFGIFALIALVLSFAGIYAVAAYATAQRSLEVGIRLALGAGAPHVVWVVLRRVLAQVGAGLVLGVAGAFAVGRLVESVLVQVSPADPLTFLTVVVVFAVLMIVGVAGPVSRAASLDPVEALRTE